MTIVGSDKYTYQLVEDWAKFPDGMSFGWPASVATDSQNQVYVFQRENQPPVLEAGFCAFDTLLCVLDYPG